VRAAAPARLQSGFHDHFIEASRSSPHWGSVLAELRERVGRTILIVEQNLDFSLRFADRVPYSSSASSSSATRPLIQVGVFLLSRDSDLVMTFSAAVRQSGQRQSV
jgi:hypothetical protein